VTRRKAPRGFSSSKIELAQIRAGALWFRLFSSIYKDRLGFGFSPSRFSDPRIDLPEAERFGDGIELSQITPTKIQEWKQSFLAAAGDDPLALRKAREDG